MCSLCTTSFFLGAEPFYRVLIADTTHISRSLFPILRSGTDAADWAKERERRAMVNGGEYNNDDEDDKEGSSGGGSVAAPTWESKLRTVDLEELGFQEGNRFMASKKIQLPEGTWRAQKKGADDSFCQGLLLFVRDYCLFVRDYYLFVRDYCCLSGTTICLSGNTNCLSGYLFVRDY